MTLVTAEDMENSVVMVALREPFQFRDHALELGDYIEMPAHAKQFALDMRASRSCDCRRLSGDRAKNIVRELLEERG